MPLLSRLSVAVLAAVCLVQDLAAQEVTAIRAGRLIDVEKGEVLRDQIVVIRGGHIESIQPASAKLPAGARTIDLSRYTVLPATAGA